MTDPIRQARHDLDRIQAHGHVELAEQNRAALTTLQTWHTRGYPAVTGRGGTGHSDPTGQAAAHRDEITIRLENLCHAIGLIRRGLDDADAIRQWARPLTTKEAIDVLTLNRPTASCTRCSAVPSGLGEDRIKAGLCSACYMADRRQRGVA